MLCTCVLSCFTLATWATDATGKPQHQPRCLPRPCPSQTRWLPTQIRRRLVPAQRQTRSRSFSLPSHSSSSSMCRCISRCRCFSRCSSRWGTQSPWLSRGSLSIPRSMSRTWRQQRLRLQRRTTSKLRCFSRRCRTHASAGVAVSASCMQATGSSKALLQTAQETFSCTASVCLPSLQML